MQFWDLESFFTWGFCLLFQIYCQKLDTYSRNVCPRWVPEIKDWVYLSSVNLRLWTTFSVKILICKFNLRSGAWFTAEVIKKRNSSLTNTERSMVERLEIYVILTSVLTDTSLIYITVLTTLKLYRTGMKMLWNPDQSLDPAITGNCGF